MYVGGLANRSTYVFWRNWEAGLSSLTVTLDISTALSWTNALFRGYSGVGSGAKSYHPSYPVAWDGPIISGSTLASADYVAQQAGTSAVDRHRDQVQMPYFSDPVPNPLEVGNNLMMLVSHFLYPNSNGSNVTKNAWPEWAFPRLSAVPVINDLGPKGLSWSASSFYASASTLSLANYVPPETDPLPDYFVPSAARMNVAPMNTGERLQPFRGASGHHPGGLNGSNSSTGGIGQARAWVYRINEAESPLLSTDWLDAGSATTQPPTNVGFSDSGADWSNPGNIAADDGSAATFVGSADGHTTDWLIASNFGFDRSALPPGAEITGVQFRVKKKHVLSGATLGSKHPVREYLSLFKGGVLSTTQRKGYYPPKSVLRPAFHAGYSSNSGILNRTSTGLGTDYHAHILSAPLQAGDTRDTRILPGEPSYYAAAWSVLTVAPHDSSFGEGLQTHMYGALGRAGTSAQDPSAYTDTVTNTTAFNNNATVNHNNTGRQPVASGNPTTIPLAGSAAISGLCPQDGVHNVQNWARWNGDAVQMAFCAVYKNVDNAMPRVTDVITTQGTATTFTHTPAVVGDLYVSHGMIQVAIGTGGVPTAGANTTMDYAALVYSDSVTNRDYYAFSASSTSQSGVVVNFTGTTPRWIRNDDVLQGPTIQVHDYSEPSGAVYRYAGVGGHLWWGGDLADELTYADLQDPNFGVGYMAQTYRPVPGGLTTTCSVDSIQMKVFYVSKQQVKLVTLVTERKSVLFNGDTSIIRFQPSYQFFRRWATESVRQVVMMVGITPLGANVSGGGIALAANYGETAGTGFQFGLGVDHNAGSPRAIIRANSTTTAGAPNVVGAANGIVYGQYYNLGGYWVGNSVAASAMTLNKGDGDAAPMYSDITTATAGTGSITAPSATTPFFIGGQSPGVLQFNGIVHYVALFAQVILPLNDMNAALSSGLLECPSRNWLTFCWFNGESQLQHMQMYPDIITDLQPHVSSFDFLAPPTPLSDLETVPMQYAIGDASLFDQILRGIK